jgi:predicted phosphodiesterase
VKNQVVVLSDIHLSDNSPTCWYQKSIHQEYLEAILDWIVSNRENVRELVLLGDVVDTWTSPFHIAPPTFAAIVEANPEILGPDGGFARVLDALEGAVTYVRGNHDMEVSARDVESVVSRAGHHLRFAGDLYSPGGDARVLMRHGNEFTMFNAPDPTTTWAPLPIGHFITRIIAQHWHETLQPGHTVAELADQGYPNGFDWSAIIEGALESLELSVADMLIDSIAGKEHAASGAPIVLADGSTTTLLDVKAQYRDLFTHWVERSGGGEEGRLVALKAALADFNASYMGWFAQRQAFRDRAQLVVMGHTHAPISGLAESLVNYVNSGFECPSVADMPTSRVSFAVVDMDSLETKLWQAVKQGVGDMAIVACPAPTASIVHAPGRDFSSYVIIDNSASSRDLSLLAHSVDHGTLVALPETIPAGTSATLWLQDFPHLISSHGSDGTATYGGDGVPDLAFSFACPKEPHPIRCSGSAPFQAKTGDGEWLPPGQVPTSGHPLFARFTLAP